MTDPSPARRPKQPMDTSHRVYAAAFAVVVFCVSWATVAAKPWATAKPDPRLAALAQREQHLRTDARRVQRVVDRRHAAYRIALKAREAQIAAARARHSRRRSLRRRLPRPRRQPAAADRYPDLVMLRRTLRAMGTDVEFLLDAPPGTNSKRALDRTEAEFERLEQVMSRFRDDSELSALNRAGRLEGAAPTSSASSSWRSRRARRPAASSIPTVHDAVVAAGYDRDFEFVPADGHARTAVASRQRKPAAAAVSASTETRSRSRRGQARSRRDRQGLRGRPGRRTARGGRALPCQRRRRPRRPRRLLADRRHRRDHARAHRRRHGDLRPRPAALAARRRRAAPPHRPDHGQAGGRQPAPRHGRRRVGDGGRGRRQGRVPRREVDVPRVVVTADGETVRGRRPLVRHDPTFWLLARASGLTAYVMLTLSILAGLVLKSRPFSSLKPAAVTDLHRVLALIGLGALAGHAAALVLDTTVRVSLLGLCCAGTGHLSAPRDGARRPRRRTDGARVRLLLAAEADRARRTGGGSTGPPMGSSQRRPCTASSQGPTPAVPGRSSSTPPPSARSRWP